MLFTDGNSNMTCAEYYRLHGTLSQERIEYLLENQASDPEDVTPYLEEAMTQYMPEDFLADELYKLQQVRDRVRGANKEEISAILTMVEDAIYQQFQASEYGRSELRQALAEITHRQGTRTSCHMVGRC